jgi:DNA repair protein RecN (Recombination protein N)
MLTHLSIQNYALIDRLDIDFSEGLTIITGETGAGKSILLGALALLVGQRADTGVLQDKGRKCVVEGTFNIRQYKLKDFFEQYELDYAADTTIRREINPEGKSRAFINDTPVTLSQLKVLGEQLIDIHSQHETLSLNGGAFQLEVVDAYAQHADIIGEYKESFRKYKQMERELNELLEKENQSKRDQDYFQFLFNELEDAGLKAGEQAGMEQELEALNNAESIKQNLSKASYGLNGGEANLLGSLNEIKALVVQVAKFNPAIQQLSDRLISSHIELKDICSELEALEQEIVHDAARIEELDTKLDKIYRLQQKHQVKSVEELIVIKDDLSNKLLDISSLEEQIGRVRSGLESMSKKLMELAGRMSANRKKCVVKIEKDVADLLAQLAMPNAQLKVEHTVSEILTADGIDKVKFLFSANKGSEFKELNKVASGGELSRLMLSIKSLIARLAALPTIIFDEIDTGVSGDVADKVGSIMEQMAGAMQVMAITHLPQIASKGSAHLFVYKEDMEDRTLSRIRKLKKDERVQEIAKMLSTGTPTSAAIKNAKELLGA